jgi:hypothetical protein
MSRRNKVKVSISEISRAIEEGFFTREQWKTIVREVNKKLDRKAKERKKK